MAPERAMVSVSMGAMNSVLSKLATLSQEGNTEGVGKGMRKRVVLLRDELESMKGLLEKLADTEDHDPLVKGWMNQVREMTYDLEDSLDVFMVSASRSGGTKIFRQLKNIRLWSWISMEIQELKQRVEEASERRLRYKLDDAATSRLHRVSILRTSKQLDVSKDSPLGIDSKRDAIIELLTDDHQQLKVVSIVGMGGLGKTTLATAVYERLRIQFDCSATVKVSRNPDMNRLLRDMLCAVGGVLDSTQEFDMHELVHHLRKFLCNKRFFIIIDDLWSIEAWSIIRHAISNNDLGSRVLVTTRMNDIAESCWRHQTGRCIYKMKPLSDSESRALFWRRTFDSEESYPPELTEISNDILKTCGGVPLAIITLASLLASSSDDVQVWKTIRASIRSTLHINSGFDGMISILNLCYIDLPVHLRTCVLYLSMFPEDCIIEKKRLIRRWMAEGFISAEHGMTNLEEVGDHYFNELIYRGLLQPLGIGFDGRVQDCQVHDIILELILEKSKEDNFATYSDVGYLSGLQGKVRRLTLDSRHGWDTLTPSEITASHVRSLAIVTGLNRHIPALANFSILRVLDLETYGELEKHYFKNIGRLYHLRYLRLKTACNIELPQEIGKLQYLETLDLSGAPRCILPQSIVKLKRLIYLLVSNAVKLSDGFGGMHSLQEVSCVKINNSNSANSLLELGKLSVLRDLGLDWCIDEEETDVKAYADNLVFSLSKLSLNLQSLYIETDDGCSLDFLLVDFCSTPFYHLREFEMQSNYYFPTVPKWMSSSLINLTLLHINIEIVGEEVLMILGELPALLALFLMAKSTSPEQGLIIRSNNGFKRLEQFSLRCWKFFWTMPIFEPGAMKNLEKLLVPWSAHGGYAAKGFHLGTEHLTLLKHVTVEIDCEGAKAKDVIALEDALKNEVSIHPNHPILELAKWGIVSDESEIAVHDDDGEKNQDEEGNDAEHELVGETTES